MKNVKKFAQTFIRNQEIFEKVKTIIELQKQMQEQLVNYEQLNWTISDTRNFLREKLLEQEQIKNMPKLFYNRAKEKIQEHLDLYFPISFADYRQESGWKDPSLLTNHFYKGSWSWNTMNQWNFDKSLCVYEFDHDDKISSNIEIAQNKPLQLEEFKNLEKRIIYAQCGGIDNIKNIRVISKTFIFEGQQTEEKFLEISLEKSVEFKEVHYLKSNLHLFLVENEAYNLNLYQYGIIQGYDSIPVRNHRYSDRIFTSITNKFKNEKVCLIWIKNNETVLSDIDNFISELEDDKNKLKNKALRSIIKKEFENIKGREFYINCREKILSIIAMENDIKRLRDEIRSIFIQFDEFSTVTLQQYMYMKVELLDEIIYYGKLQMLDNELEDLIAAKEILFNSLLLLNKQNQKTKLNQSTTVKLLNLVLGQSKKHEAIPKTKVAYKNEESNNIVRKINNIEKKQQEILKELEFMTKNKDQEKYILVKEKQNRLKNQIFYQKEKC